MPWLFEVGDRIEYSGEICHILSLDNETNGHYLISAPTGVGFLWDETHIRSYVPKRFSLRKVTKVIHVHESSFKKLSFTMNDLVKACIIEEEEGLSDRLKEVMKAIQQT